MKFSVKAIITIYIITRAIWISKTIRLKALSFYHTTHQIDSFLENLPSQCLPFVSLNSTVSKDSSLLKYYDISFNNPEKPDSIKDKVFILSGEHPREMIAVELVFNFIKSLCKDPENLYLLENNNFRIIVNANPKGRINVENGELCNRANINDVDINRNWGYRWSNEIKPNHEENPGNSPFSEIETVFIKDALTSFKPKAFFSIHSGVYGLFHPYAYTMDDIVNKTEANNMKTILNIIKEKYCKHCYVGSPAQILKYYSYGNCLDYAYDVLKIPYSFAWEIFTKQERFEALEEKKRENELNHLINPLKVRKTQDKQFILDNIPTSFIEKMYTESENQMCINHFNPMDRVSYDFIISNFQKGLIETIDYINSH